MDAANCLNKKTKCGRRERTAPSKGFHCAFGCTGGNQADYRCAHFVNREGS